MTITLNRPEVRNAVNLAVATGIGRALEAANFDSDVRVVLLTGAGEQAFCAGADLKALAAGEPSRSSDPREAHWGFAGLVNHPISKPIIAAVNGFALGGGTEIALACDLVVASESASFGLPEVRHGLLAAAGGAFRLTEQIPKKAAMEFLLTGRSMTAAQAHSFGLVNRVVEQASLIDTARELATTICLNAPLSVQATKRIALRMQGESSSQDTTAWMMSSAEASAIMQSDDAREGMAAFSAKRKPVWTVR